MQFYEGPSSFGDMERMTIMTSLPYEVLDELEKSILLEWLSVHRTR